MFFCSEFKGVVQHGGRTVRGTTPLNSEQLTRESVKGNEKRGTLGDSGTGKLMEEFSEQEKRKVR